MSTTLDPAKRYPVRVRYALVWIIIGLVVLWYYFFVEVSYDSIPSKPLFWFAFLVWMAPGIAVEWAYRKLPTKPLIDKYANFMIGFGLTAIAVGVLSKKTAAILPIAYALLPGAIVGGMIGSDSLLVWTLIKNRRHRPTESNSPVDSNPGRSRSTLPDDTG